MSNHLQADPRPLRDGSHKDLSSERNRTALHHVSDGTPQRPNMEVTNMKLFMNHEVKNCNYNNEAAKAVDYLAKSMMGHLN